MESVIVISLSIVCLMIGCHLPVSANESAWSNLNDDVQEILRSVPDALHRAYPRLDVDSAQLHSSSNGTGCQCIEYNCGCCADLRIPAISLDNTVCVNTSYLPKDFGISLTMTIDKRTILNVTISARNPPPICIGIPYIKEAASLCVDLYNLDYTKDYISGCVKLQAKLAFIIVESVDLGCFKIPLKGLSQRKVAGLQALVDSVNRARRLQAP